MNSLVLELQRDALDSSVSILNLLRKALVVAQKLSVKEFREWIELELNGYSTGAEIPEYRLVKGEVNAWNPYHGWVPIILINAPEVAETISKRYIGQPISELEALQRSEDSILMIKFSKTTELQLMQTFHLDLQPVLHINKANLSGILEAARDVILRWSLQLEEDGILGEGLTFSQQEKVLASKHNYQILIENIVGEKSMSSLQNNDFRGASIGGGVAGRDYTGDVIHNHATQQNLAEAAAEIQQLLRQLEQSYPTETLTQKAVVAEEAIKRIENNPTLKGRVIGAFKSAGKEAFKEAVDHPLVNVLMAGIEGWQQEN